MRHKDTAALREFLKGYREADEKDVHPTDQQERLPMPPMEVRRGGETVELPERDASPLGAMLENRYSLRSYDGGPLTLEEVSFLLWAAQGVKAVNQYRTLRTAPSGGARHPLELYVFVNNVTGLAPGAYHYLALEGKLERLGCRARRGRSLPERPRRAWYGRRCPTAASGATTATDTRTSSWTRATPVRTCTWPARSWDWDAAPWRPMTRRPWTSSWVCPRR